MFRNWRNAFTLTKAGHGYLSSPGASVPRRSAAEARLLQSSDSLRLVCSLLAKRAEKAEFSSRPADLAELREDPRIRFSGVSHPESGLLSNSKSRRTSAEKTSSL